MYLAVLWIYDKVFDADSGNYIEAAERSEPLERPVFCAKRRAKRATLRGLRGR